MIHFQFSKKGTPEEKVEKMHRFVSPRWCSSRRNVEFPATVCRRRRSDVSRSKPSSFRHWVARLFHQ